MPSDPSHDLVLHRHAAEHYTTVFNRRSGFFARIEDEGHPEPFWAPSGPELIDVSITGWCDRGCPQCYRAAGEDGRHLPLDVYEAVVRQAASAGTCQVALGGGNPNQHPDFCRLLELTREEYGIVPSLTTNGRGLTPEVLAACRKWCGAVAVSAHPPYDEFECAIRRLKGAGIRANAHFVLSQGSIGTAIDWLKEPPSVVSTLNALVFLNYKPVGRGAAERDLVRESDRLDEFFRLATKPGLPFKVGFDSCLASGLAARTTTHPAFYDACEAARFSMFVSEEGSAYPCSFMVGSWPGMQVGGDDLLRIWREGAAFATLRDRLRSPTCSGCDVVERCRGGCPFQPGLAVCGRLLRSQDALDPGVAEA